MTQIKVYYDSGVREPTKIEVSNPVHEAKFAVRGSSAVLTNADCSGEFLSEAFAHVEELGFVQAVTMEAEE